MSQGSQSQHTWVCVIDLGADRLHGFVSGMSTVIQKVMDMQGPEMDMQHKRNIILDVAY